MNLKTILKYYFYIILTFCTILIGTHMKQIKVQAKVNVKQSYMDFLSKEEKRMRDEDFAESEVSSYQLIDINNDGKKELIYTYWNGGARGCGKVCMIKNRKVKILCSVAGQPVFYKIKGSKTKLAVGEAGGAAVYDYEIFKFSPSKAKGLGFYSEDGTDGTCKYYKDEKRISKKSFMKLKKKLKEIKMKDYKSER